MISRTWPARARNEVLIKNAKNVPCRDCGVKYPDYVMHFDHVRGEKKFNISMGKGHSREILLAEIQKCEVVCANCHAKRTFARRHAAMVSKLQDKLNRQAAFHEAISKIDASVNQPCEK